MNFHSIQNEHSIASVLWRLFTALVLSAMVPLALAQQVLSPATISFGNVPLTVPVTQTGTFTNNSTFQLVTITALSTSDARFAAVGSGASPCNVGAVVTFGASCTYALTFTPSSPGAFNNTTTVAYNVVAVAAPPLTQTSSGTGFTPPSTASPPSILFGNVPLTVISNQLFTFTNNSNTTSFPASYTLTSFVTSGLGFSAVGSGTTPCAVGLVLPPAASCGATASFQINGSGASNGTSTIGFQTGQGANPVFNTSVALNGVGFAPPFTNAPASLNFGNVVVNVAAPLSYTFTNNSDTTLFPSPYTLTSLSTTGLGYTAVGSGGTPCAVSLVLPPGSSCGVTATFQIAATGSSGGSTTIGFLAGLGTNPPYTSVVALSGTGVAPPVPVITSPNAAGGITGSAFTYTILATNSPTSFGASGLPAGLTVNTSTGIISGTPSVAGTFAATITATNAGGTGSQALTITITAAPTITSAAPVSGTLGTAYTHNFTASGTTPITWSIVTGTVPTGLTLNATSGILSGTPTAAGSFGFTIQAANGTLPNATLNVTIVISAAVPPGVALSLSSATVTTGNAVGLILNIANPGAAPLTAGTFTFTYPAGVVTATLPGIVNSCGGTFTSAPGSTAIAASGLSLGPAGTCALGVSVSSATAGSYVFTFPAGAFSSSNGSNTVASNVTLTVTAVPTPGVALTPVALSFGTRTVSTTSPPSTVTLGNSGTALLTITSITASGDYAFTTSCPLAPSTLAVGIACPINVTFTPLAVGARPGNITIVSNAPGSPHTIGLSGTGSGGAVPNISLAPAALAFGAQTVNTASALQSVVVSNTGFANLIISGISVSAPFSRVPLGAVVPPDCGGSVAPGNTCQIGVIFTPASSGTLTGQISIIDNATGSPHTVGLSGTGVSVPAPVISANAVLAFGDQVINGTGSVQNLSISNIGTATLNISAITLTGTNAANFTLTGQSGCASIAPAGNCSLTITFATATVGARTAQVNITSNAQNAALVNTVSLTGNGILAPRPVVNITATAIGYGNVIFGGATPNQFVTLTNNGGQVLSIANLVVTGDFIQMSNCGTSLASLASCTISIVFTPLGQGARFGEFILTSSATTSPDRIQLSGTGCRWFSQAQSRFFLTSCGP